MILYVQMPYSGGPRTHAVSSLDLWHESLVSPASLSFTFVDTADAHARAHSQQMPFRISRPRLLPNPAAYGSPARLSTYVLVWFLPGGGCLPSSCGAGVRAHMSGMRPQTIGNGYITASGRSSDDAFWYVVDSSTVQGTGTAYLGRPWRDFARVVFQRSTLGSNV